MNNLIINLETICLAHPQINQVVIGDPFILNNMNDVNYPIIVIDIIDSELDLNDVTTNFKFFYIDRLFDDGSNDVSVEVESNYILNDILTTIVDYYSIDTPITINPFKQRFLDECAGGYCDVKVRDAANSSTQLIDIQKFTGTTAYNLWMKDDELGFIKPVENGKIKSDIVDYSGNTLTNELDNLNNYDELRTNNINDSGDYTGFINPKDITVTYNSTGRTITLIGDVRHYYRGYIIPDLINGWTSIQHPEGNGTFFLHYCDGNFIFDTTPWSFDCLQIAFVQVNSHKMGVREVHSLGDHFWHQGQHQTVGTYMTDGGDLLDYTLNSTVDRRPNVSSTSVMDEDLPSTITSLTTKLYTHRFLSGATNRVLLPNQTDIIKHNGGLPFYNRWTGTEWVQTIMSNNQYASIFLVAIPTTDDEESKLIRYMWVQPQSQGTLQQAQSTTINSLTHADPSTFVSEFVFIGKIIIRTVGNNWQIHSVEKLTGTRVVQIASPSGNYLSNVETDASLTGDGTVINPLSTSFLIKQITGSTLLTSLDSGYYIYSIAATNINVTIPTDIKKPIVIFQKGNGVVSFVDGQGVTHSGDIKTAGQNKAIYIAPETNSHYQIIGGVS